MLAAPEGKENPERHYRECPCSGIEHKFAPITPANPYSQVKHQIKHECNALRLADQSPISGPANATGRPRLSRSREFPLACRIGVLTRPPPGTNNRPSFLPDDVQDICSVLSEPNDVGSQHREENKRHAKKI